MTESKTMHDMLKPFRPSRLLRSAEKNLLEDGLRSFEAAAPRLWNTLPQSIRNSPDVSTFKKISKQVCLNKPIIVFSIYKSLHKLV